MFEGKELTEEQSKVLVPMAFEKLKEGLEMGEPGRQ